MDSKQNDNSNEKVELLDFAEKEKKSGTNEEVKVEKKEPNKFITSLKAKIRKFIEEFKNISLERQSYIIVAVIMIFSLMIGLFGDLLIIILAAGILFTGVSGKAFFIKMLKKASWNKKKNKKTEKKKIEE